MISWHKLSEWWTGGWWDYTWHSHWRCAHINRFGVRCFRVWTYDHWCGLHNSKCWPYWPHGNRHNLLKKGHH